MITFKLLLQLISNFPLYVTYGFKKYPLGLICLIVISLGISILSYWNMNIDLKSLKSASKKYIFLLVLFFLGQFFVALLLGLTVLAGEFLIISNSDLTSPYFYIEICIIAVVYEFLQWRRIKNGDFLPDDSDIDEYISEFTLPFKMILLIIVSFIFLVTDLENVLPHWGMTLFGNTIGQWIYNVFFSLAISYMVEVVVSIVQYVIVKTFKLPFKMIRSKH